MAIVNSRRTEFIGAHVDPLTRILVRKVTDETSTSISAWVSDAIEEKLIRNPPQTVLSKKYQQHMDRLRKGAL